MSYNPKLNLEFNDSAFEAGTLSREEHLWHSQCRALANLKIDPDSAFASMMSDLIKHEQLKKHAGISLGLMLKQAKLLDNKLELKRWIEGFN